MEIKDKLYWDMQKNCIAYAQKHQQEWAALPVMVSLVDQLTKNEKELQDAVYAQESNKTNGHTEQKNQAFAEHSRRMYKLGRKLTLFAKEANNAVVKATSDISESSIDELPENEVLNRFTAMIQAARQHQNDLASYGVTAEELTALESKQQQLKQLTGQRNAVGQDRRQATRSIKECIAEARRILNKLDDAFEGLLDDDALIAGWFDVRKIKGRRQSGDDSGTNTPPANT